MQIGYKFMKSWKEDLCKTTLEITSWGENFRLFVVKFGVIEIRIKLTSEKIRHICAALLGEYNLTDITCGGSLRPVSILGDKKDEYHKLDQYSVHAEEL